MTTETFLKIQPSFRLHIQHQYEDATRNIILHALGTKSTFLCLKLLKERLIKLFKELNQFITYFTSSFIFKAVVFVCIHVQFVAATKYKV